MRTLDESILPLRWVTSFLGLTIFESSNGEAWIKSSLVYILLKNLLYWASFGYSQQIIQEKPYSFGVVHVMTDISEYIDIATMIVATALELINYKNLKQTKKRLARVDETLMNFGIQVDYDATYRRNVKIVVIWAITMVVSVASWFGLIFNLKNNVHIVIRLLEYQMPVFCNSIFELNFIVLINETGKRFRKINQLIKNIIKNPIVNNHGQYKTNENNAAWHRKITVQPKYDEKPKYTIEQELRIVRQLHLELCTICRKINHSYANLISMEIGAAFFLVTAYMYCIFLTLNEKLIPYSDKLNIIPPLILDVALSTFRVFLVIRSSVFVMSQAKKTADLAHKIQVPQSQPSLTYEIHELSLQTMQNPLLVTTSDLNVLDFYFMKEFLGSIVTYLLILIQNQSSMITAIIGNDHKKSPH